MGALPADSEVDTKSRLLDVAERLFAERGFEVVSLRDITREAEANLAAVNYHFGSKDGLIVEVISRRVRPINRERLKLLGAVEERSGTLREVLDAFLRPVLVVFRSSDQSQRIIFRLMGRCLSQDDPRMNRLLHDEFSEVIERFVQALSRALPALTRQEVFYRLLFVAGVMAHTLLNVEKLGLFMGGGGARPDLDKICEEMLNFAERGCASEHPEGTRT